MVPKADEITSSRTSRSARWLIGLLCVLALVGHDIIMTANPHASAAMTAAHAPRPHRVEFAPAAHAPRESALAGHQRDERAPDHHQQDGVTDPDHDAGCSVVRAAALASTSGLAADSGEAVALMVPLLAAIEHLRPLIVWDEPTYPPGVRRALIQVYRE